MKTRMIIIRSMLVLFFIVTLFAAITDFAEGRFITVSWIVFAGVLSAMGAFWRSRECLFASLPFWAAALARLFFIEATPVGYVLVFNARFFMFLLAACFLFAAYFIRRKDPLGPYMIGFAIAAMITIIIGSLKENYSFVSDRHYRNLGYSYVLSFYAALFFAIGIIMKHKMLRISGIALAGLVILKFYLHDIWTMSKLVKIIAGFTLGIAMVALSIIYQKFRDRIFPRKGSTAAMIIIAALSMLGYDIGPGSAAAGAETFRASSWHYYKTITPGGENAPAPVYGKFFLDDDMIRYGNSADYRVTWNGRPRPHMTRTAVNDPKLSGSTVPEIIFRQADHRSITYVLKLPEPPAGAEYNGLEVYAANQFEASALVEIGKKAGEWESSGNYAVFSYQGTRNNMIRFSMGDRRFVRIRINSRQEFSFPKAYYSAVKKQSYYIIRVPLKSITRDSDSDVQGSVYYYENSGRKKISRLVMAFKEKRYNRLMEIYSIAQGDKKYYRVMGARLSRSGGDPAEQVVDMNQPVTGSLKLVVIDKDDEPLTLASLTVYVPREELIFELPPRDEWKNGAGGALRLYYGNRYSLPPAFDIPATFDQKLGMAEFKAGPQKKNEAFAYSAMEPPVSTWIIRIVFLLGLAGLAYPAWRILRHYTAEGMK